MLVADLVHLVVRVARKGNGIEVLGDHTLADEADLVATFVFVQLRDRNALVAFLALARELLLRKNVTDAARVAVVIRLCVFI